MSDMKTVELFTDGACSGNPGPGGWGAILRYNGIEKELSGGEENTTNNRMELTAVIKGLKALKSPCKVLLCTDSKYVCDGVTKGWAEGWRLRGCSLCLRRCRGRLWNGRYRLCRCWCLLPRKRGQ
ncbi:MAG: hypothetical protein IIW86_03650, partial [Clostridia bacterium]|nr:hypothetical protein [Clostridia bacterium]